LSKSPERRQRKIEMIIQEKKSAIDLTELAIGIVVLGIAVSIGAVILLNIGKSQIVNAPTYSVINESIPAVSGNGNVLSTTWVKSVDEVFNESASLPITSGNYTLSVDPNTGIGTVTNTTAIPLYKAWTVSYTVYNVSDPRFAIPNSAQIGLAEYGDWFKILVIVGIAAVLLAQGDMHRT